MPTPGLRIYRRSWTGCPTCGFSTPLPHRLSQRDHTGPPRTIASPVQNAPRWTHQVIQVGFDHQGAQPMAGLDLGDRITGHSRLFALSPQPVLQTGDEEASRGFAGTDPRGPRSDPRGPRSDPRAPRSPSSQWMLLAALMGRSRSGPGGFSMRRRILRLRRRSLFRTLDFTRKSPLFGLMRI